MKTRAATQAESEHASRPLERAIVLVGSDPPRVIDLGADDPCLIGRADDCRVRLDDPALSRHHASITLHDGRLLLRDHGSRNGVRVGDVTLRGGDRELRPGDAFRVGRTDVFVTVPLASREAAQPPEAFVAADPAMREVLAIIERFAPTDLGILVLGETGVGKEVVANAIHERSLRASGRLVSLHCASLPPATLESELFGHERGAFTGAEHRRIGWLEAAAGGTLFLDELGELSLSTQVKLLRFLETKRLSRLGSHEEIEIDARLVCATHEDLTAAIAKGRFREDLFYRVSACTVRIPPLRERPAEIPLLAALFVERAARAAHRPVPMLDPGLIAAVARHAWPGNVRELRNAIEHAFVMAGPGPLTAEALPASVLRPSPRRAAAGELPSALESLERERIHAALEADKGNRTHAARRLGVSRRALIYKLKKYGLS